MPGLLLQDGGVCRGQPRGHSAPREVSRSHRAGVRGTAHRRGDAQGREADQAGLRYLSISRQRSQVHRVSRPAEGLSRVCVLGPGRRDGLWLRQLRPVLHRQAAQAGKSARLAPRPPPTAMTRMCLSVPESRAYRAGATRKRRGRGKGTMSKELYWLTLTAAMTGLFWLPYILDRIMVRGLMGAMANPSPSAPPQSRWAERQIRAHANAVENLIIFAPLVLTANALGISTGASAAACAAY